MIGSIGSSDRRVRFGDDQGQRQPPTAHCASKARFTIVDATGKEFGLAGRTVISLCRCGHSASKPFCDGSHGRAGFQSVCEARELPPPKPKA